MALEQGAGAVIVRLDGVIALRLEGLTLAVFVIAVLALTFYQEGRSENAIEALRTLSQPTARVIRSGAPLSMAARELVRGDLLLLAEGERISADGLLLTCEPAKVLPLAQRYFLF